MSSATSLCSEAQRLEESHSPAAPPRLSAFQSRRGIGARQNCARHSVACLACRPLLWEHVAPRAARKVGHLVPAGKFRSMTMTQPFVVHLCRDNRGQG